MSFLTRVSVLVWPRLAAGLGKQHEHGIAGHPSDYRTGGQPQSRAQQEGVGVARVVAMQPEERFDVTLR